MEAQLVSLIAEIKLPQAIVDQLVALGLTNAEDLYWSWQVKEHRESQIRSILDRFACAWRWQYYGFD